MIDESAASGDRDKLTVITSRMVPVDSGLNFERVIAVNHWKEEDDDND